MWDRRQFIKSAFVAAASLAGVTRILSAERTSGLTYTVRKGDTLSSISQRFNLTVNQIRAMNALSGDRIDAGQTLVIQAPPAPAQTYIVQPGDTLGRIASRHNTSVQALQADNHLSNDTIFPGQELIISGGSSVVSRRYIGEVVRRTEALRVARRPWQYIVAHHSGVKNGNAASYDRFHRRHMGMPNGLAYHFVIGNGIDSGNGEIEIGNRWTKQLQGGHVRSYRVNEVGIGICLVGNFEVSHPTSKQIAAFTELMQYLKNDLLSGGGKFMVHREVDGSRTLCPGKNFPTTQMHRLFS